MKTLNITFLAILIVLLGACTQDFLDTIPITKKTDGNYYSNPDEATEALVGCYDALQLIYTDDVALPVGSEIMSDMCFSGLGVTDADNYKMIDEFDMLVSPADQNLYEGGWKNFYKGVFRCNTLINKLDNVKWGDRETERSIIEAEARFLRAYLYFDMVRLWENIPLLVEPSSKNIPQAHPDSTYKQIAKDLLFAINNAKQLSYTQIETTQYGHANKWAAESMMARVFLYYTGYYGKTDLVGLVTKEQALNYTEDVITKSGHDLLDNFSDLWPAAAQYEAAKAGKPINDNSYAGENNKEIVFSIKYTYTSNYDKNTDGNHWMVMNGLRGMSWTKSGYALGWGANTVLPEVYKNWDANDKRREASIMAISEEGINYTGKNDVKEYTGYFTKKYTPICDSDGNSVAVEMGGVNFMIGQFQDYFVIRFADVLLMAAELGSTNGLTYLNKVRERARVLPVAKIDKDVIYEERRCELAFEGIRYWDLLRYDNTLQYAADKINFSGTVMNGDTEYAKNINGNNIIKTRGLSQIPYNQITLSGGLLKQNNGW